MDQGQPPLRTTSTPLRKARTAPRRFPLFVGIVLASAVTLGTWLGLGSMNSNPTEPDTSSACDEPECHAERLDVAGVSATAGPTPCAYCNQDPHRWRAFTTTAPPEIGGDSAAIIEASCGTLLYGTRENDRLPPASLTKIAAALVTMHRARLTDIVDVKLNGWDLSADDNSTIMGLEAGMRLPVEDLVYGMMLVSGNDAALALAEHFGGASKFVDLMNQEVRRLGLVNTHFVTPDGRDAPGHYSTTLDMALLGRTLLQDPRLDAVVNTKTYKPHWDGPELRNNNEMIYAYQDAVGIKTGYTETAEFTIVTGIRRDGRLLIASVFGGWHLYLDAVRLLNWAFDNTRSACTP